MERDIFDQFIHNSCHSEGGRDWDNDYRISDIEKEYTLIKIDGGYIVWIERDIWVDFFVFEESGASYDSDDKEILTASIIWHGDGPLGNLRELRHSYFNPYLFYINAKVIEASFQELRKHFDI